MLEKIKNWIIKIWDKYKDNLEPEEYKLSHDRFAKLIFNDILTIIPSLMLSKYNSILFEYGNLHNGIITVDIYCNIFKKRDSSQFQINRCDKKEYHWNICLYIDKNNFGSSLQQLVTVRDILKSLTKEEPHYSQDEINKLMEKARELDRKNIKKDVDNS